MAPTGCLLLFIFACSTNAQTTATLDSMGPVSLGKDGSLNRVANWDELTPQEKETAVRLLAARNEKRRMKLLEEEERRARRWWGARIFSWFKRVLSGKRRKQYTPPKLGDDGTRASIDFAPEFIRPILDGTKRATTRYCAASGEPLLRTVRAEQQVRATCVRCVDDEAAQKGFALLEITRVERTRLDRLNATLAATEGLASADELRAVLKTFYPTLRKQSEVRVLHFSVQKDWSALGELCPEC